jgi:ABC-type multidrug transport system ATPase subunit
VSVDSGHPVQLDIKMKNRLRLQDEPTSGLDARAAAIVMRTVRNTVNTGRTVVCTIHQPSIDIFEARVVSAGP